MKITTLLENKTTCDALRCEHGLSLYIETAKHKILFDSGASDAFWENGKALGASVEYGANLTLETQKWDGAAGTQAGETVSYQATATGAAGQPHREGLSSEGGLR